MGRGGGLRPEAQALSHARVQVGDAGAAVLGLAAPHCGALWEVSLARNHLTRCGGVPV